MNIPTARSSGRVPVRIATLLLPVASLLLVGLAGEGIFRILGYGRMVRYEYAPELGWVHRPNQEARMPVGGWNVRIDAAGFRGPEYSVEKSPGQFRVLLLGDSYTFGWAVAEDSTYGRALERLLGAGGARCRDVQVLNAGVNGYNTEQEVAFVRRTGLRYQPDVVIVGFTPNDIMMESETKTMLRFPALRKVLEQSALYQFLAPRVKALILPSQRRAYDETLSKFLGRPDSAVLARWAHVRAALLQLNELAERDSFHLLVAAFPFVSQLDRASRSAAPQELLRQLNSESGIPVLDLLPAFQQAAARGEQPFLPDDPTRHPSSRGHAIAAQELYRFMASHEFLPACIVTQARRVVPKRRFRN